MTNTGARSCHGKTRLCDQVFGLTQTPITNQFRCPKNGSVFAAAICPGTQPREVPRRTSQLRCRNCSKLVMGGPRLRYPLSRPGAATALEGNILFGPRPLPSCQTAWSGSCRGLVHTLTRKVHRPNFKRLKALLQKNGFGQKIGPPWPSAVTPGPVTRGRPGLWPGDEPWSEQDLTLRQHASNGPAIVSYTLWHAKLITRTSSQSRRCYKTMGSVRNRAPSDQRQVPSRGLLREDPSSPVRESRSVWVRGRFEMALCAPLTLDATRRSPGTYTGKGGFVFQRGFGSKLG
jgi:hypothetical protein